MLRSIQKLLGADRPKVIVVVATSPDEAAQALAKASPHVTGEFPKWCICPGFESGELEGFDRVLHHRSMRAVWRELRMVWPALMIVFWTGSPRHHFLKALPLLVPPFRMLVLNEAGGAFSRLDMIARHLLRRLRETLDVRELVLLWLRARVKNTGEWLIAWSGFLARAVINKAEWCWAALNCIGRWNAARAEWCVAAAQWLGRTLAQKANYCYQVVRTGILWIPELKGVALVGLQRLITGGRPKTIVVLAIRRESAVVAMEYFRSEKFGKTDYPFWCLCLEACEPVEGYHRFESGITPQQAKQILRDRWAALTLVSWTGEKGHLWFKLGAFFRPPFRVNAINETGDIFSKTPYLLSHGMRRLRDKVVDLCIMTGEYASGAALAAWVPIRDFTRALGLFLFAFVGQFHTAISRFVFDRLRGTKALRLDIPALPQDITFAEVCLDGRKWRVQELPKAQIIVFRQHGETADVAQLLKIFELPQTFSVALQTEHTDWRKKLVAKFPFRKLQPGELTRTQSPYSTLIAFRRDALTEFGLPAVLSAGSAYMLLHWQAAAAGWHSYTIGGQQPVSQEADVPLEHAEFVRLLLEKPLPGRPALCDLAPLHVDLGRGNIMTSLEHRKPFRGKPRVLVLSPYLPFPLSHGGAVRIFNMCRSMAHEIDFVLACFREKDDVMHYDRLHEVFREVYVVDNDEKYRDPSLPKQIPGYRNSAMRALVKHLCGSLNIELLQIEYTQMAEYRDCAPGVPVLLVEHDVTFTLYRQIWETKRGAEDKAEYERWLAFERQALADADCTWAMSGHDREVILQNGGRAEHTFAVPNGVDLERFQPQQKQAAAPRVLFVGSFRHLPNLLAFEALRNSIMPEVWKAVPSAELHVIAGSNHERWAGLAGKSALLQNDPRILLDGFVEDVRPAYRDADVVAIPLPVSAGTNIKLMEAMACGRASVSTPVGCVGLELTDGVELEIRELDNGFAAAVTRLLTDSQGREAMAASARRTAEERFGWDAIAREALGTYPAVS